MMIYKKMSRASSYGMATTSVGAKIQHFSIPQFFFFEKSASKLFLKIIFHEKPLVERNAPFVETIRLFVEYIFLPEFDPVFLQR